ncbi:MAG: PAS domain-containing protein [Burkholderiaceae bacterium]|nr:PAS domain-containing protein [Burkholderiaceae bacterium]
MPPQSPEFTVPEAVAAPMLAVDRSGVVRGANSAFSRACGLDQAGVIGQPLASLCPPSARHASAWHALATALRNGIPLDDVALDLQRAAGTPWPIRLSARPSGAATWLTLTDATSEQNAERLQELLDMAQQFGRLGVWERDVRTLQGRWDRHVHRFWGLPADAQVPDFAQATSYVVPEDREELEQKFRQSTERPGVYSLHYRVRGADGVLRRLYSQWTVKNGVDGRPERAVGVIVDDTEVWHLAETVDETHAQLDLALQLGGIAIWRHDLASNRLYYDDQGWRILGLTPRPEGLSLEEVRAMIHPDDVPAVQAAMQRAATSNTPTDMEARYRHADGHWLDILTRRVTQRDAHGQPIGFIGVGLDVTERLGEQRRLQELTRRLELAVSVADLAIWTFEPESGHAQWNEQMYAVHGLDASQPAPNLEQYLERFVPAADRAAMRLAFERVLTAFDAPVRGELRIVRSDGALRELSGRMRMMRSSSGSRMIGTLIDVTEQRARARALREAHERAALAARAVGLGTWELDHRSRSATWDEQMWRLRGLEPRAQPLTEDELQALVHPDDLPQMKREYEIALRDKRPASGQFRVRWPDGSWHWLASRSMPMFDEHGNELRRIGVNWDITQAREAEQVRQERMLAQRESRAKSLFLARMSHELRTPLNAVIGFAQLLLSDRALALHGEPREQLQHIQAAGQHLLALVNDVLDLSSLDTGEIRLHPQALELGSVYDAAVPMVAALAATHGVRLQRGELAHAVLADPTRLRQVLLNLLTNAIKYNRPAGTVQVESHALDEQVVLQVRDTGRGMASDQLLHVFEPFNRLGLERKGIEGTGIGLAIVKANVERMGGSVHVQSTPGVGSVFEVRLPSAANAPAPAPAAAPAVHGADDGATEPGRTGRLLYIEDNPVNALIVRELVAQRGNLKLDEADDGASGIQSARECQPDLILVDMQLPDFDGLEVLRRLRADPSTAAIPCIALSANAMPEDIQLALGAGFADYWTKPLDFRVFLGTLDTLFGKRA